MHRAFAAMGIAANNLDHVASVPGRGGVLRWSALVIQIM